MVKPVDRKFSYMAGSPGQWDVKIVCGNIEWHLQRKKLMAESPFFQRSLAPRSKVRRR